MRFSKHQLAKLTASELITLKQGLSDLKLDPLTGEATSELADKLFPHMALRDAMAKLRQLATSAAYANKPPGETMDAVINKLTSARMALEATPELKKKRADDRQAELKAVALYVPWAASALASTR